MATEQCFFNHFICLEIPEVNLYFNAQKSGNAPGHYWAKLWPSAWALAGFLHAHKNIDTKSCLELGAGLALPSLLLAKMNKSSEFVVTDTEPKALQMAEKNALRNGLNNFKTRQYDLLDFQWNHWPETDLLLMSDLAYEPSLQAPILRLISEAVLLKKRWILSLPDRYASRIFLEGLTNNLPDFSIEPSTANGTQVLILHNL